MIRCSFCNKEIEITGTATRSDTCPHCGRDLRCCVQCKFYDPGSYNECKEVSAERVMDKERANFCDYFIIKGARESVSGKEALARQSLDNLFKKK